MKSRNIDILEHMLEYCQKIGNSVIRFGDNEESFLNDDDYKNSICMSLMQIGELSTLMTDDYRQATIDNVDWRGMKGFRNIVAHDYRKIDLSKTWGIVKSFIPELEQFCTEQLSQYNLHNQEANEPEYEDEDELEL